MRPSLPAARLKELIVREVQSIHDVDEIDADELMIHGRGADWVATVRPDRGRIDETECAAISATARRLAAAYDCS